MEKRISALVAKAVRNYSMIKPGEKVLAAVSGGKDSLAMLHILKELSRRKDSRFELHAASIRTDFHCAGCVHRATLTRVFEEMGVVYHFRDIKVLDAKKRTSCFWCSWNRRKALFELAHGLGIRKIAFGHHKDDIIETSLLNLFFHGEISSMTPRQELFAGKIVVIRPLCFIEEEQIKSFVKVRNFPSQLCQCPFGADSKRRLIKEKIRQASDGWPTLAVRDKLFQGFSRAVCVKGAKAHKTGICI
jgi:tRNA 2-thiocytidine biosynthesis protein TtcA